MRKRIFLFLIVVFTFLLASCGAKTFNVTFNSDGGTEVISQEVVKGEKLEIFNPPTKEGYEFSGWYNGEDSFDIKTPITSDLTLTAKWKVNEYVITFDYQNTGDNESRTIEFGSIINEPNEPNKKGFVFEGWYENLNSSNKWNFSKDTMPSKNITLFSKFRKMNPEELLFDYYVNVSTSGNWIYKEGDNYVKHSSTEVDLKYYKTGYYEYIFSSDLKLRIELKTSTIKVYDNDTYYSRDFLYKTYDFENLTISLADDYDEIFDSYYSNLMFNNTEWNTDMIDYYGYTLTVKDFNPNWETLENKTENRVAKVQKMYNYFKIYGEFDYDAEKGVSYSINDFYGENYDYYAFTMYSDGTLTLFTLQNGESALMTFKLNEDQQFFSVLYVKGYQGFDNDALLEKNKVTINFQVTDVPNNSISLYEGYAVELVNKIIDVFEDVIKNSGTSLIPLT